VTSNWNDRSLAELKAIVDEINPAMFAQLRSSATHFQSTASTLNTAESDLLNHMGALRDAWQGKAASAAVQNAQQNAATMNQTSSSSDLAQAETDNYLTRLESDQRAAQAVPDVDTSWGHAFSSGGWAGPIGVGVAKYEQQQKYDNSHAQMVKLVSQMDSDGSSHSATMKSMDWPSGSARQGAPPATLPPVPGAAPAGGSSGGNPGGYSPGGGANPTSGGGYTPVAMGPGMDPNDNAVLNGPRGNHGTSNPTQTQSGPSPTPQTPTITQGGPGGVTAPGAAGTGPSVSGVPTTTAPGAPGAAAAVLGGAGLLGAGALGGRGPLGATGGRGGALLEEGEGRVPGGRNGAGLAEGEGEPGLRGPRSGAFGEGEPGLRAGGRAGAFGEGEPGLRGSAGNGGFGESEGALRGGVRGPNGIPADEELGAPRNNMLGGSRPAGFGGEPVAGEAGRLGGYPMGGMGGRRGGDDEESPVPDYLVETDDIWGDGANAAPPVIGE
jgi:uncharacterized protein YukE